MSNENSLIFDKQNSERPDVNSRMSNLAEPSFSNEDHDDSLYDALSIDAQAPIKIEISNHIHQSGLTRDNISILNSYGEDAKSQNKNRFSLIDLEYIKSDKELNKFQSRIDHTDLMLDLKETSIDEILLIADEIQSAHDKQLISKQSEKTNLGENSKNLNKLEKKVLENSIDTLRNPLNSSDEKGSDEDSKSKTNLQRLKERISAIDLNDKRLDDGLVIMQTPQPELVNDDYVNETKEKSKDKGAFKLYTTNIGHNELSPSSKILDKNEKIKYKNNPSSFYHLNKQMIKSNDVLNKSKRGPIKKYRSESVTNLSFENNLKKNQDGKSFNKRNSERIRPATHNEITYTLDSDESTIIDNLIKNPERLKQKLKQSRIERDQLNQLQQNYTRLLQQYAEAENFIDAFRLNAQVGGSSLNPTPVAKGSFLNNESKSQTNVGSQPNFNQPSIICSSNSTLSSNQINIEKNNSLNGSRTVLVTDQTNPLVKSISLTKTQSNDNLPKYKEFSFQSQSANNFQPSQNLYKNSSQSTVYVIPNTNKTNPGLEAKSPTIDENSRVDTAIEDNIVIDQTSTLGILVQIKVLEDKMQSFVTLVNENQLNKSEQRQVFDSIQSDYQIIIQNFDLLKATNSDNLVQQQIEMDVDLNKELGKMKSLLDNIVHKMNDNLIDATSDYSDMDQKHSFENTTIASFDDNRDELMGQYNRLLDIFNHEQENINDSSNNNHNIDKSKEDDQIRSETVCSVFKELDSENSFHRKSNINKKIEKKQKSSLSEPSEATNEINNKILKNNSKLISSRTKKELIDNKNTLNKKISRLSFNRVGKLENQDSDKNHAKNVKKTPINENISRNLNTNRRLTRMSNESSTETLTTSDNESTKIFSDPKPSFRNYIDEITDDSIPKSKQINFKKCSIPTEEERRKNTKKNLDNDNQPKIKPKVIINTKKREYVKQNEETHSEQEYSDQDITIRQKNDVRVIKQSGSNKKSLSIGNIPEHSKNRKNEKKSDIKNFPIARAYEGSDSLEDLDSSISTINGNFEYAYSTVVKTNSLKKPPRSDKRTEYIQMLPRKSHKHSLNDINYDKKYIKNNQPVPKIYHSKKRIDDSAILSSDIDSVVEKRNALKTSKKDLMKKLTEEVKFLKQEILKKNAKYKTSDEKIQHSDFPNSDTKNKEYDSQLNIIKDDKINNCALKSFKMNTLTHNLLKHKNYVHIHPRVLVKNNKNILVLKNNHGKEKYFCMIDQNELDRKSVRKTKTVPYDSIVSKIGHNFLNVPTIKSTDYQDVKNYKFSSVQNLLNLKREDRFLDDYYTDEEPDNNFFTDTNFLSNRVRSSSYSTKDRRYLSNNDIFERKSSNRRNDVQYYLSKCSKSFSRDRGNFALSDYSIQLKKENDKSSQIPIVVGKPIDRKSRDCLIFLPVNNPNVTNKVPVNFIPYPINENKEYSGYEIDNSVKNLFHSSNVKYSPTEQKDQLIDKGNISTLYDSNESSPEKKTRKIRYYIREYTDISTVSDNDNMYRRFN